MKQLENGYAEYYYMTDAGLIYNSKTKHYIKPDKKHSFKLNMIDGTHKYICLKKLYKEIYNKNYCIDNITDIDNEKWKDIEIAKGYYMVSNMGRIKSLQGYKAIILNPYTNQGGYRRVDITISGKRQCYLVHKLVAAAWLPLPKDINMQLHHKDFNLENNSASNLEWLSPAAHHKIHKERYKNNVSTKPKENIY